MNTETKMISVDRDDLDNVVFAAAQEAADTVPGLTVRAKMKWSLETADRIMAAVDSITEAGKRSEAGRKAAQARHSKTKPTPGPAIPPPAVTLPPPPPAALVQPDQQPAAPMLPAGLAPPPHPALAPFGPGPQ